MCGEHYIAKSPTLYLNKSTQLLTCRIRSEPCTTNHILPNGIAKDTSASNEKIGESNQPFESHLLNLTKAPINTKFNVSNNGNTYVTIKLFPGLPIVCNRTTSITSECDEHFACSCIPNFIKCVTDISTLFTRKISNNECFSSTELPIYKFSALCSVNCRIRQSYIVDNGLSSARLLLTALQALEAVKAHIG